ncbi:PREDICTED: uncharacterized protein LOC109337077 isoform X2 [Lupinus angustifolius]|uniref:uncharacterized protein LOC109337077 isoform X2 n=1 Tax=Lupinus angustifolius TaxID=3871 RepID=UPI00092FBE0C|nr:PREDICTED: uncharacterized protein LOC109337077 isoform X2 [Lupinus angustifolius]
MSLLHAGFLDEIAVLKGFLISPNARVTVSVKKETTGAIGHVVEARRTRFSLVGGDEKVTVIFSSYSCMRIVTLRRSTGSLCCETYATLFPYQSAGLFISLSEKLGSLSLVANTLTYCSS